MKVHARISPTLDFYEYNNFGVNKSWDLLDQLNNYDAINKAQ
jgi:hypothetical protein